jgi:hypothetical protein
VTRSFVAASAIAQTTATCTAAEAAKHVGEIATVTDRVDGVHQSGKGNIFLNMGGKYPNQAFTAFIPSASGDSLSLPLAIICNQSDAIRGQCVPAADLTSL